MIRLGGSLELNLLLITPRLQLLSLPLSSLIVDRTLASDLNLLNPYVPVLLLKIESS